MADHRSSGAGSLAFASNPDVVRGRHRAQVQGHGTGVKAATVAAATGAIIVGGTQLGGATASAATIAMPALPADVTAGLQALGVQVPATLEVPDLPGAPTVTAPAAPAAPAAPVAPEIAQAAESAAAAIPGFATTKQWIEDQAQIQNAGSATPLVTRTVQPVNGTLTSNFGSRWGTQHGGTDIAAPIGTPILAAEQGTVISAGPASGFGQWVRVMHPDRSITVYGHVNDYQVNVGDEVAAGQQIATVGNRGQSTGPHLHFEVWNPQGTKIDPAGWLHDKGVAVNWAGDGHNH